MGAGQYFLFCAVGLSDYQGADALPESGSGKTPERNPGIVLVFVYGFCLSSFSIISAKACLTCKEAIASCPWLKPFWKK